MVADCSSTQSFEELERLAQALDPEHCRAVADDAASMAFSRGSITPSYFASARMQRGRQRTLDASHAAVERELADHQVARRRVRSFKRFGAASSPSAIGRSNAEPSLRMSAGARLIVILRVGKLEAGILDRRLDAILRFLDRALGQPDQPMRRNAGADINLDFDWKRVNANQRAGYYACVQEYLLLLTAC